MLKTLQSSLLQDSRVSSWELGFCSSTRSTEVSKTDAQRQTKKRLLLLHFVVYKHSLSSRFIKVKLPTCKQLIQYLQQSVYKLSIIATSFRSHIWICIEMSVFVMFISVLRVLIETETTISSAL